MLSKLEPTMRMLLRCAHERNTSVPFVYDVDCDVVIFFYLKRKFCLIYKFSNAVVISKLKVCHVNIILVVFHTNEIKIILIDI